jgi:hypothetical protein
LLAPDINLVVGTFARPVLDLTKDIALSIALDLLGFKLVLIPLAETL